MSDRRFGDAAVLENTFETHLLKQKISATDLRPLILLVVLLAGLTMWVSVLYWLHHNRDQAGVSNDSGRAEYNVVEQAH